MRDIWSLSDYSGTRINNHLIRQETKLAYYLSSLAKWLIVKMFSRSFLHNWLKIIVEISSV